MKVERVRAPLKRGVRLLILDGKKDMKVVLIILLTSLSVVAQTKDDLRKKFGEPISETFIVRSGIVVTATYSATGQVKELLLGPEMPDLIKSKNKKLSYDVLRGIIEELVPAQERGKSIGGSFLNLTCLPENDCAGSSEDYEKLTIYYNAGRGGSVNYAVIQWKLGSSGK
jgi:hypothetical protein